jgi:hypothetical protein
MRRLALASLVLVLFACGENQTHLPNVVVYDAGPPQPLACIPNLDGKIDANELRAAIGVPAHFLVSPAGKTRAVDVAGKVDAAGHHLWDLSVSMADDQVAEIRAATLDGKWYASSFPGAEFTAPFDVSDRVDAVYAEDDKAVYLLGLASSVQNPPEGSTLLVYQQPVALFKFPLQSGLVYTSIGVARNAMLSGLPYAGKDTYEVAVDASGQVTLPDLTFTQALRVRTKITLEPAVGKTVTQRQVSFLFECFGEVARFTSANGEPLDEFTSAVEVRRLALQGP